MRNYVQLKNFDKRDRYDVLQDMRNDLHGTSLLLQDAACSGNPQEDQVGIAGEIVGLIGEAVEHLGDMERIGEEET